MAFAVESATGQTRTGTNAALSFTVTSANLLLVAISVGDDSPNPSSTLAGVALARGAQSFTAVASSAVDDGVFTGVKWFRLDDPTAGTTNITSTGLDAAAQASVHAVSFTGANLTLGTPSTATGSAANPSLTVAASASGDIVVAALCTDNASADTVAANTSIFDGEDVGSDTDHNSQYKTASGANTVMAWTNADSGSGWSVSGLAVSPAASSREQEGFRWGVDDNNEASHGFEAAQDTDITILDDQSRLLRALVNATGDPATAAYTLRVQKNGSGGYSAVAVGAATTTSPPTAPTATVTTIGTAADPWTINRPAASTGDLIVFVLAWDDSVDVTSVAAPTGVNSETAVSIAGPIASASTEMREQAWYYIATGAWTTGTLSFNPSATETVRAVAFVIPAAQFNAADPIGFANTRASAGIAETSVLSPTGTAEGNDGSGRLYIAFGSDTDALTAPGSNWNTINNATGGGVGLLVGSRNTLVSNSESITALTATIAGDSWATLNFVVKPKVVANEVYVVASANIAAGGEATTARLTAPAGKSTSDFVTGRRWDDENGTDSIDITTDDYTELEWLVYIASSAVNGDFYDFRVYAAAAALDTYTVTPRWTIGTSGGRTVNAATEALTLTRQNASIARSRALSAATEVLTLTRHNATVARSRGIAAATEALALTAQPATIGRARGVSVATEALVLVGLAATVTFETTNDRAVDALTELLALTGQPATIATARGVFASAAALTLTSFSATVRRGEIVTTVIRRSLRATSYVPSKSPLNTDPVLRSYTEREFQAVARSLAVPPGHQSNYPSLAALFASGEPVLYLDGLTTTVITEPLIVPSNTHIIGAGPSSVIKAGANIQLLILDGVTNVTLENFRLDGDRSTYTSNGNYGIFSPANGAGSTNIEVRGVEVVNMGGSGIIFLAQTGSHSSRITIKDCYVFNNGAHGIICQDFVDDTEIVGNRVIDFGMNTADRPGITTGRSAVGHRVLDNYVRGSASALGASVHGISMDNCNDFVCNNNVIEGTIGYGIELGGAQQGSCSNNQISDCTRACIGVGSNDQDNQNLTISGNVLTNSDDAGIYVLKGSGTNSRRISITGNTIDSMGGIGISLQDACLDIGISGNVITNSVQSGIHMHVTNFVSVVGNFLRDNNSSASAAHAGIRIVNTASESDILVENNLVTGSGVADYTIDNPIL